MMCKKLFYLISLVLLLVISAQVQAEVIFSDDFDQAVLSDWSRVNYQGWYLDTVLGWPNPGGDWVIGDWDGYQSLPDPDTGVSPTVLAYNYVDCFNIGMGEPNQTQAYLPGYEGEVLNGVLRITSAGSFWEHAGNTGPFLYKMVEGDFVAQVEIVSFDHYYNNMGGLMARDPNPDPNENWTQVCIFPLWGAGNRANDTVESTTSWLGAKGFPCDPYLRLQRVGNTFSYYTSPDGEIWTSLPGLEDGVVRDDLPAELQVGIFQANFAPDWQCTMDFDNFSIETVSEPGPKVIYVTSVKDQNLDEVQDNAMWVDWLEAEGYDVDFQPDNWVEPLDEAKIAELEAADLIIASRGMSTGSYDGDTTIWNSLTTPMICTNAWMIRSSRWVWMDSTSANKDAGAPLMMVMDTSHPIFAGVELDQDGLADILDPSVGSGHTSFLTDILDVGNGTLLAQSLGVYNTAWIVEWPAGVEYYDGAGQTTGGNRILFMAGTQDDPYTDENGNIMPVDVLNLNDAGKQMFLNAMEYLL